MLSRRTTIEALGAHQITRRFGVCEEHLVQRAIVKTTDRQGLPQAAVLMRPPRPLTAGKKATNCFGAAASFFPVMRKEKAEGIIVNAFCFDRALWAPQATLLLQRQKLWYSVESSKQGLEALPTEVLDWSVAMACANHDTQNAL
eukprot:9610732-Lingulodinium_polyedra.AAC.1